MSIYGRPMGFLRSLVVLSVLFASVIGVAPRANADDDPASVSYGSFKPSEQVSPFQGSFGTGIPIAVPPFHGIEPGLALAYSSTGGNGIAGVGWSLTGFRTIERASPGRGTPRFTSADIYLLDGMELVPCGAITSPSCSSGGTHATKNESYQKIKFDSAVNTWTVWNKSGVRTVFSPVVQITAGTFRWGISSVIDTKGNTVTYTWTHLGDDWYPGSIQYGPYVLACNYDVRPDIMTQGQRDTLATTSYRLASVAVGLGTSTTSATPIRAYKVDYVTSTATGRSLLASVTQYGKDAVFHNGIIGGPGAGSTLPPQTFTYTNDALANSVQTWGGAAPTPPGSQENVAWTNLVNTTVLANGDLQKSAGAQGAWDAGASSTRSLAWGDGKLEFMASSTDRAEIVGLSVGDDDTTVADVDFGLEIVPAGGLFVAESGTTNGPYTYTTGDTLSIEITSGVVSYKRNGTKFYTSTVHPKYPLLADVAIAGLSKVVHGVKLTGTLQDAAYPCTVLLTADFNADGRTDVLCYSQKTDVANVRLGTATGLAAPTAWLSGTLLGSGTTVSTGDFNGDGKADLAIRANATGGYTVALSTGTSFSAPVSWGVARATPPVGQTTYCGITGTSGAGDFNGDGITDVWCKPYDQTNVFVGLSNGSSAFTFSVFAQLSCSSPQTGETVGMMDFNGDGKDDYYCISGDTRTVSVYPSDGAHFGGGFQSLPSVCVNYIFGDFNGDGRPDITCKTGDTYLSTGFSFVVQPNQGNLCTSLTKNFFAADLDGDGKAELICNDSADGPNNVKVRKWNGTGFDAATNWKQQWCAGTLRTGDFNGDGKSDLLCDTLATPVAIGGTDQVKADLMATATNGMGGTTTIAYAPSTTFADNQMSARPVVTARTMDDGRGGTSTDTYSYSGGRVDRQERAFLGFRSIVDTLPCAGGETTCPTVETTLRQDLALLGAPDRVVRTDGAGHWLVETDNAYATTNTPPRTGLLVSQTTARFDGTVTNCSSWPCPNGKRGHTEYQYDSYANRTQAISFGDDDLSGDETTTTWTFAPDTTSYIVGLPVTQRQLAGASASGQKLAETSYTYDAQGFATAISQWKSTDNTYVTQNTAYDGYGNPLTATDATSKVTTYAYDAAHLFPISITDPTASTATSVWDPSCGVPTQVTDSNGQVTTTTTDVFCRTTRVDQPLGSYALQSYIGLGDPATQHTRTEMPSPDQSGGNAYLEQYFDGFGRVYRAAKNGSTLAQSVVSDTARDARGRVVSRTAPYFVGDPPRTTTYDYDILDRLQTTHHPDGSQASISYDLSSTTTSDEHSPPHAVTVHFDTYGRRVAVDERLGAQLITTQYTYDAMGRMTSTVDSLGNTWTWTFDSLSRLTQKSDPDSGLSTYTYDDAGRILSRTDAKGQATALAYDSAGRLSTKTVGSQTTTMVYDTARPGFFNRGRVTAVQSPQDTLTTDYDALGRAVKQVRTFQGVDYTIARQYDAEGMLKSMTYPDGEVVGPIAYDAAGGVRTVPGFVTDVTYEASGRPVQQTNVNGTSTSWTYSPDRGFLTHVATTSPSGIIQSLDYEIDSAGLVMQVASSIPGDGWGYAYDDLHRLTQAVSDSSADDNQNFSYDEIGRVTYNSRIGGYTYPTIGAPRIHGPLTAGSLSYAYDADGNVTSGGGRTIQWTANNLPSQINATQFTYDGAGARLSKTTGSSTTIYPVGDDYEIANGVVTKYISLPGLGLVAKKVGASVYWLHVNAQGSIQAITDATGAEVLHRTYRPYGEKLADSTTFSEARGYIGERTDDETGLAYLHARYYDPAIGLFLSPDPANASLNTFAYGSGNPLGYIDPSGLSDITLYQNAPNQDDGSPGFCIPGTSFCVTWDIFEGAAKGIGNFFAGLWNDLFGGGSSPGSGSPNSGPTPPEAAPPEVIGGPLQRRIDGSNPITPVTGTPSGNPSGPAGPAPAPVPAPAPPPITTRIPSPIPPGVPMVFPQAAVVNAKASRAALVQSAYNDLFARLGNANCASVFGGADVGRAKLMETSYRFHAAAPSVGAFVPSDNNPGKTAVFINPNGAFVNAVSGRVTLAQTQAVDFGAAGVFRSFMLGHELSHQVGVAPPDTSNEINLANSLALIGTCY